MIANEDVLTLQEYKGEQLTAEEIDLLKFYEDVKLRQEEEAREKRATVVDEDTRKRVSLSSSRDENKQIKKIKPLKVIPRRPVITNDIPHDQLDSTKFPAESLLRTEEWRPASGHDLTLELTEFGFGKNQTLAMKITVPESSKRYSFNICPPPVQSGEQEQILYHFNPRRFTKLELVENDKDDSAWGRAERHPLDQLPRLFDYSYEIMLQVNRQAFHIYIDGQYATSFAHRRDVSNYSSLVLNLPWQDDYKGQEEMILHQVWWGVKDDYAADYAVDSYLEYEQDYRTNLFINNLPKVEEGAPREDLQTRLFDIFAPYHPVDCRVMPRKGYAFMKVESPEGAAAAIDQLRNFNAGDFVFTVNYAKQRFKA